MAGQIQNARALLTSYADKARQHVGQAGNLAKDLSGAASQVKQLRSNLDGSLMKGRAAQIETNFKTFLIPGCLAITSGTRVGDANNTVPKSTAAKDQAQATIAAMAFAQDQLDKAFNALMAASKAAESLGSKTAVAEASMRTTASTLA